MSKATKVISIAAGRVKQNPFQITLIVGPTRHVVNLRPREGKKAGPGEVLEFPASACIQLAEAEEQSDPCNDHGERPPGAQLS